MNKLNVFCLDDSELKEFDSINRGYRSDIYININNDFFNINIYDIIRLQQDFESEIISYGFFSIEPNVIIVKKVTIEIIIPTIYKLYEQKYFDKIKPIVKEEIDKLVLIQISPPSGARL